MLISGFSFARNADKLNYPFIESIQSILPICDEFIIAVGRGDEDDATRSRIHAINDPKIRIIDTEWDGIETKKGHLFSEQTNLALNRCEGTWCFYLQGDEVIHERYLPAIRIACEYFKSVSVVDGFLFNYKHFWGDYDHHIVNHRWYPREIRIVRNRRNIVSIGDAQSFRYTDGKKIPVVSLDADVFHYGHVRDPRLINIRREAVGNIFKGIKEESVQVKKAIRHFDYGSLEKLPKYRGSYPAVMKNRIEKMDWKHLLQYSGKSTVQHPHDRLKYRFITFIEQKIFRGSGREFWGNKQYRTLHRLSREFKKKKKLCSQDKTEPEAALIVAVYNHADFLEKVFCSLSYQTEKNVEVIIADDGSGPEIEEMIAKYKNTFLYPIKHVFHDDNGFRKTVIVNKAVMAAKAPYYIFIDGDCILHHRFIEFHLKRKRRGTVLSGRRVKMNQQLSEQVTCEDITSRRIEKRAFWRKKCNRSGNRHGIFLPGVFYIRNLLKRKKYDILGSNFSTYKDDFLSINGYDERIIGRGMEDDNLAVRFNMAGILVKTIAHEALQYHLHHSSTPIPHDKETIREFRDNPGCARTPWGIVKESVDGN